MNRFLEYRRTPLSADELDQVYKYFMRFSEEEDYIFIQ